MAGRTSGVDFGTGAQPPPELAAAIVSSSERFKLGDYGPQVLAGIWREEAGGKYPNPYVNSSGYGGLFGTKDAYGPVQEQSDLAASVFAAGLKQSGGIVSEALSYYNSGRTHGGYTTVPGLDFNPATGIPVPPGVPGYTQPSPGGVGFGSQPSKPGHGGSFWGGVGGFLDKNLVAPWSNVYGTAEGAAEATIGSTLDFMKAALWLLNWKTWLRATETIFGFVLILVGIIVMVGGGSLASAAQGTPVAAAASAAGDAAGE